MRQTGILVSIAKDLIAEMEETFHYETPIIMGIVEVMLTGDYRCVITNKKMVQNAFEAWENMLAK